MMGLYGFINFPWLNMDDTAIDDWLDSMGFNLDEVDYMINPNITINDER